GARCEFPAGRALDRTVRRTEEVRVGAAVGADEPCPGARTDAYELSRGADHAHHGASALAERIASADPGGGGEWSRSRQRAIRTGSQADVDREAAAMQSGSPAKACRQTGEQAQCSDDPAPQPSCG